MILEALAVIETHLKMYSFIIVLASLFVYINSFGFHIKDCNRGDGIKPAGSHSYFTSSVTNETSPCRAQSTLGLPVNANYQINVSLQSMQTRYNSTPGLVFNVQDDKNFDMVFFRVGDINCIVSASYVEDHYKESRKQICSHKINWRSFFKVGIVVKEITFIVTVDGMGPFVFRPRLPRYPSVGFIQGMKYRHLCNFSCELNFRSLKLDPETEADIFESESGIIRPRLGLQPNQLQVHRVNLRRLGKGSNGTVAVYFQQLELGTATIYLNGRSDYSPGMIRFYFTERDLFEIYIYADENTDIPRLNYTIHYQVLGLDNPKSDLSFVCDTDTYLNISVSENCQRSTATPLKNTSDPINDAMLGHGWYDITTCSGNSIPELSPGKANVCGTKLPIWFKPPTKGIRETGLTTGTACVFQDEENDCKWQWDLPVYKCDDKVLYYLIPTPEHSAYCVGNLDACNQSENLTTLGGSQCAVCKDFCPHDEQYYDYKSHNTWKNDYGSGSTNDDRDDGRDPGSILGPIGLTLILVIIVVIITVIVRKRCRQRHERFHYKKSASDEDLNNPLRIGDHNL